MSRLSICAALLVLLTTTSFAAPAGQGVPLAPPSMIVAVATTDQVNAKMADCRKSLGPLFMGVEAKKSGKLSCIKAKNAAGAASIEQDGKASCDGDGRSYLGALDDKGALFVHLRTEEIAVS